MMTATTGYRGIDPRVLVELQNQPDPDTGQFRTADVIRGLVKQEYGVDMTVAAVREKARRYRRANNLGPAPINQQQDLPWDLPNEAHHDVNGYALHRIARREKARERGEPDPDFHPSEAKAVAAFEKFLRRQGKDTVVAWDAEGNGWVTRPRKPGEHVRYGVMASKPYP